jgi:hypothetical protein
MLQQLMDQFLVGLFLIWLEILQNFVVLNDDLLERPYFGQFKDLTILPMGILRQKNRYLL